VAEGNFSFYSEITVKHNKIEGYVSPVFEDMEIYKDGKETFFHKFYEGAAIKLIKLFEGHSDEQAPIETKISGSLGHGNGNTWSAVAAVARDAFSNVILPAFKREAKRLRQGS
jgi:hypothetical protein